MLEAGTIQLCLVKSKFWVVFRFQIEQGFRGDFDVYGMLIIPKRWPLSQTLENSSFELNHFYIPRGVNTDKHGFDPAQIASFFAF